ncbi:hypothetical protein MKX08_008661 [Trichoderma sp. CBMAI-0020]|nr:hypothetical protein MKX08_008661 [Trichoderma sp. CBMAI-0020]
MSSRGNSVYVHQSTSSRSSSSSGRSAAPSPRPSTTTYREYGARDHTSQVIRSGPNTVVQHNKRHYDPSSPSPSYRGQ